MAIKYSNNARSLSDVAINDTETTISVVDIAVFPTLGVGDVMYLTLSDAFNTISEIVKCTDVTGSTLTIERAQEDTTALSWISGSSVQLRITAGLIEKLLSVQTGKSIAMSVALGG